MNKNLLLVVSALGISTLIALQACSSDAVTTIGGDAGEAGEAGEAGKAAGGSAGKASGAAGEGGALIGAAGTAGAAGESTSEGGASAGAGGEGGAAELTQAELCDQFCTGEAITCAGELQQYADTETCLAACNSYALGKVGDTTGNTLDCRIYHLNAAMTSAATHCPHTSATPTAFCIN